MATSMLKIESPSATGIERVLVRRAGRRMISVPMSGFPDLCTLPQRRGTTGTSRATERNPLAGPDEDISVEGLMAGWRSPRPRSRSLAGLRRRRPVDRWSCTNWLLPGDSGEGAAARYPWPPKVLVRTGVLAAALRRTLASDLFPCRLRSTPAATTVSWQVEQANGQYGQEAKAQDCWGWRCVTTFCGEQKPPVRGQSAVRGRGAPR